MGTNTSTHARHAYLLLIDGLPWAWTSNHELTQSWWTYDDRVVKPGLMVPDMKFGLDLEKGVIADEGLTFKLLDVDGTTLPSFFSGLAKEYKLLGVRLTPGEDPSPASTFDQYGDVLDLWDGSAGSYLGLETIGPDGERHYYSAWPGKLIAGLDHGGLTDPLPVHTDWTTGPFLVEGRRACLYRIFFDPVTNTWSSFDTTTEKPLWWGTLEQAGSIDGRTWSIQFSGPVSWIRKTLNAKAPTSWYRVNAELELVPGVEDIIYINARKQSYNPGVSIACGVLEDNITAGDLDAVIASITGHVATAISTPGPAPDNYVWEDQDPIPGSDGHIGWTTHGITIWTGQSQGYAALLMVRLHWKVWRFLGWDPEEGLFNVDGLYFQADLLNPGYYIAWITTTPAGKDPLTPDGSVEWDGDGVSRVYELDYAGGVVTLSGQVPGQVKIADIAAEPVYIESQLIRPPKITVSIDGTPCNATRWWVFKGMEQRPTGIGETTEAVEVYRVAKCSWVSNDGVMGQENGLDSDLYIEKWLDPRLFGLNFQPIDPQLGWAGSGKGEEGGIFCSPLAVWGIWSERNPSTGRGTDRVADVLRRLLVSTGTAVIDNTANDSGDDAVDQDLPYLTPGVEGDHDLEIADLGLQVPEEMVDLDGIAAATAELPGTLRECKVAVHGAIQAEDLLLGLLGPGDWSMSLRNGQYGVFRRSAPMAFDGIDFEIGISDLAGTAGDPASCIPGLGLRPVEPFDKLVVSHTSNPVEDPTTGQEELLGRARDVGARARQGVRNREVSAPYLPTRQWWSEPNPPVANWELDFLSVWEPTGGVAGWLSQPHRMLRGLRISRPKGQFIYPGSVLLLTLDLPGLLNPSGTYGFTNLLARVLSVTHEADSCAAVVDCLVQATPGDRAVWAPIARVIDDVGEPEERHDPAAFAFYCQSWSDPSNDVTLGYNLEYFVEPFWSSSGGNAIFWVLQYDGTSWTHTCTGEVDSVDVDNGILTYVDGSLTGTFYNRMYAVIVLAPYDAPGQAAWAKNTFHFCSPKGGLTGSRKLAP